MAGTLASNENATQRSIDPRGRAPDGPNSDRFPSVGIRSLVGSMGFWAWYGGSIATTAHGNDRLASLGAGVVSLATGLLWLRNRKRILGREGELDHPDLS